MVPQSVQDRNQPTLVWEPELNVSIAIDIELYPFDQCREIPVRGIYNNLNHLNVCDHKPCTNLFEKFGAPHQTISDYHYHYMDGHYNQITIYCSNSGHLGVVYYIFVNNTLVAKLVDKKCTYQSGDAGTNLYDNDDNDFIIENHGDVSSVLAFNIKCSGFEKCLCKYDWDGEIAVLDDSDDSDDSADEKK
jgi:hypothetical protein